MPQKRSERTAPAGHGLTSLVPLVEQAEGWGEIVRALHRRREAAVDGTWGSSDAWVLAGLANACPGALLCVCAHPDQADDLADDLESFLGHRPSVLPAWSDPGADQLLLDEAARGRLRVARQLTGPGLDCLVASVSALMEPVPSAETVASATRRVSVGQEQDMDELARWLLEQGFRRMEVVELPGELATRGGIMDVLPLDAEHPVRIEFFGDRVESIREFDVESQRSLHTREHVEIASPQLARLSYRDASLTHVCDLLGSDSWAALCELADIQEEARHFLQRLDNPVGIYGPEVTLRRLTVLPTVTLTALPGPSAEATCHLRVESIERFSGEVSRVREELEAVAPTSRVVVACDNEAEIDRLGELLGDSPMADRLETTVANLNAGFRLVEHDTVVLSHHELFQRYGVKRRARRAPPTRALDSFLDLADGDLVVHAAHGIARFRGLRLLQKDRSHEEHLVLEFRDNVVVYVPASKIELVQKYVGGPSGRPSLSKIGTSTWENRKRAATEAATDLACELLDLQAARASQPGIAYPSHTEWQREFEASFIYDETPDQLVVAGKIQSDMAESRPMDRLVCGDVGYGKTELAMRAAFRAVDFGKQAAVLVPTTVLAEQHFRTFSERMADYPITIEVISRFKTRAQQHEVLQRLALGQIDVIIGTHRLVQSDVQFSDLGLVVIDEEQRFGVAHKERLKALRRTVDVLTLTATPIPRTLHMALLGIRDISNLTTAPQDRLAIETRLTRWDPAMIRHAILRELNRNGQIYFVHNRVYNIQSIAENLEQIVPEARFCVAHGQMNERELASTMMAFVRHHSDVLVATTIIESGLDIPNVNTIFINQAQFYGLADLHQLRGRVGRYKHRAYAYLLVDESATVSPTAVRRLKTIEEYAQLGAGFRIAMRDLEIRGAGNILGAEQSGHIVAVGYDMYSRLLDSVVRQLRQEPLPVRQEVQIGLHWHVHFPRTYVPGQRQKIELYRRLSSVESSEDLVRMAEEMQDRFGPVPPSVRNLLREHQLRVLCRQHHVASIAIRDADLVLECGDPVSMAHLVDRSGGRLKPVDQRHGYLRLRGPEQTDAEWIYRTLTNLLSRDGDAPIIVGFDQPARMA